MTTETMEKTAEPAITDLDAIDCDVHPRSPLQADLLPFLDAYWRDMFPYRDINRLELTSYPTSTAAYSRPDSPGGADDVESLQTNLMDRLGLSAAILNVVNATQAIYDPYMQAALCAASNRWVASEWLDRDPRLRASLLVPWRHPEAAVREIERNASDNRFVQILALAMGEAPLGQRMFWPIYEAAQKHGLALSIHPGSAYRTAPTQAGYPSYLVEAHVAQTQGFANQVVSLVSEGVLGKFPELPVVCVESGVSWLFGVSWRVAKDWRGARMEVPWVKESPAAVLQERLRLTIAPFDAPLDLEDGDKVVELVGSSDMLLFSTDFPHDHGNDLGRWPDCIPARYAQTIARDNALATYPRLEL
jgi:predicted TIM-barrel fold metal-dependent hydrolase